MGMPKEVKNILHSLGQGGFQAYIVGGCVRDLLLKREPFDWDVATNARPEEIQEIFPDSFYENEYGTVGVKTGSKKPFLEIVEATTYRIEEQYSDKRHPDRVNFTDSLETDLSRRDFTINAIAVGIKGEIVDPFNGQKDLEKHLLRAVGEAKDRFKEDALRMIRAVRFAAQLDFEIEENTQKAIKANAKLINFVAKERVGGELMKLFDAPFGYKGIILLRDLGLLKIILPELSQGIGLAQNKHHIYTVFEHGLLSFKWAVEHKYSLGVKIAALFHDIGKPATKEGEGRDATFYGHEMVGAGITSKVLSRFGFHKKLKSQICQLIRYHMFYYNIEEVTEKSVRRLLAKIGPENMGDLIKLRICDRMGSGAPKAEPYRLRHFQFVVEKVQKDPISPKMIKINGGDIMKVLKIEPGPKVGQILAILLDEILDSPKLNTKKYLNKRVEELGTLSLIELGTITDKARARAKQFDKAAEEKIKEKYWVK